MKVLVTGATGFIGRHLVDRLLKSGHLAVALTRNPEAAAKVLPEGVVTFRWDPEKEVPPPEAFQGVDAVVHLAGENLARKRWTRRQMRRLRDSRLLSTRNLVKALTDRRGKPLNVVMGSAIGYYGDRGEESLRELSEPGKGFLAELCRDWEREGKALPYGNARLVSLRTGVVLGGDDGVLKKLMPVFKLGGGGPIGDGKQWMSWIHVEDLVSLIMTIIENPALEGAINGVSPEPVRNEDFSLALGKALNRPTFLRAPAFMIRLAMGKMSEVVLGSQRVLPEKALNSGFKFRFPNLDSAIADILGK